MNDWISVYDRLPEKTMPVEVIANDIVSEFRDKCVAYVCPEYGNVIWENADGSDYVPIVTRWRPENALHHHVR